MDIEDAPPGHMSKREVDDHVLRAGVTCASVAEAEFNAVRAVMRDEHVSCLLRIGIKADLVTEFSVAAGPVRITFSDGTFAIGSGEPAALILCRGDGTDPGQLDNPRPSAFIRMGDALDLVAVGLRRPHRSATLLGEVDHVGLAPLTTGTDARPCPIWLNPLDWLRAGGLGIAFATDNPERRRTVLLQLHSGVVAFDRTHARELHMLATRPFPAPRILLADGARHAH